MGLNSIVVNSLKGQSFYTKEGLSVDLYDDLYKRLLEEDIVSVFLDGKKIRMVGIYKFADGCMWYGFPKYYCFSQSDKEPTEADIDNLKIIARVIEKLRKEGKNVFEGMPLFDANERMRLKKRVDLVHLSKIIVNDFLQNGLYEKNYTVLAKGVRGKTNWSSTVRKALPLFVNGDVIYDSPMVYRKIVDEGNIIRDIHANVVSEAIDIYEKTTPCTKIKKPDILEHYSSEKLQKLSKVLESELLHVFSDRELNILKEMIAWCAQTTNYKYVGCTNCFQNVWEWVNDAVFGNIREKESQKPSYFFYCKTENPCKRMGTGTAKPDTLFFGKDKETDEYYLHVYDAKYYLPKSITTSDIEGYPANADIVKQIAYINKIKESLQPLTNRINFKNIFLVPESKEIKEKQMDQSVEVDGLFREVGYVLQASFDNVAKRIIDSFDVEVDLQGTSDKERVYLYMVYCSRLYEKYLNDDQYIPAMNT